MIKNGKTQPRGPFGHLSLLRASIASSPSAAVGVDTNPVNISKPLREPESLREKNLRQHRQARGADALRAEPGVPRWARSSQSRSLPAFQRGINTRRAPSRCFMSLSLIGGDIVSSSINGESCLKRHCSAGLSLIIDTSEWFPSPFQVVWNEQRGNPTQTNTHGCHQGFWASLGF